MQVYQSLSESRAASQMSQTTEAGAPFPDGRFPDSVESASSTLVSTIEEIRNNQSLCSLYYGSSEKIHSESAGACPQVPTRSQWITFEFSELFYLYGPSVVSCG